VPVAGGLLAYRPVPCLRPSSSHAPASALAVCAVPCASHHATDTAACRRADNAGKEFQPWSSHRISPAPTPGRKSHSASRRNRACAPVAPRASGNRGFWPKPSIFCSKGGDGTARLNHHAEQEAYEPGRSTKYVCIPCSCTDMDLTSAESVGSRRRVNTAIASIVAPKPTTSA